MENNFEEKSHEGKPQENGGLTFKEIKDLEQPLLEILETLGPKIERGEYTHIVGDDASGRLVALVFREIFNLLSYKSFDTKFIAGTRYYEGGFNEGYDKKKLEVKTYLAGQNPERVLIVTDFISTGRSLLPVVESLQELEVDFDIATICIEYPESDNLQNFPMEKVTLGYKSSRTEPLPAIYDQHHLAGVVKKSFNLHSTKKDNSDPKDIAEARRDIKKLAGVVVKKYKESRQSQETA